MLSNVLVIAVTLLAALGLVATQKWHGRFSLDNAVGVQSHHKEPTPRVGGVAIAMGLAGAWILAAPDVRAILGSMMVAGLPAFLSGLLEDLTKRVGVLPRLLATMASGVLAWYLTGVAMQNTGLPPLDWLLECVALSADNHRQLWVPPGFAHGFVVTSDSAEFLYKTTDYWYPEHERSLLWSDPGVGVQWPLQGPPQLAAKDSEGKLLIAAELFT